MFWVFVLVIVVIVVFDFFFFFNDTATTEIYTLSLHDALPISSVPPRTCAWLCAGSMAKAPKRSEEHTSELQSRRDLVCRLLLEKKKDTMEVRPLVLQQKDRRPPNDVQTQT